MAPHAPLAKHTWTWHHKHILHNFLVFSRNYAFSLFFKCKAAELSEPFGRRTKAFSCSSLPSFAVSCLVSLSWILSNVPLSLYLPHPESILDHIALPNMSPCIRLMVWCCLMLSWFQWETEGISHTTEQGMFRFWLDDATNWLSCKLSESESVKLNCNKCRALNLRAKSAEWKFLASGIYELEIGLRKFQKWSGKLVEAFFFVSLLEKVSRKINVKLNRIKREKLLNFKAKNFCNVVSFRRKNIMKSSSYARQNSDFRKCLSLKCVLYLSTSRAMPSRLPSNKYPCSTESQQLSDASWSHSGLGSKIPPLFSFTVKTWLNVNCFVRECALLRNGRGLRASSFCVGLMFFCCF